MDLKKEIREIPDYPRPGISFKDITTLVKNGKAFGYVVEKNKKYFKNHQISKVVALEARGFIFGGAIAHALGAGFVPVRKKGKLPYHKLSEEYTLEYGTDKIEMHIDAINENDVVLIHDDLLATGGTALAALKMVQKMGAKKIFFSFVCDLEFLNTEAKSEIKKFDTLVLVKYN